VKTGISVARGDIKVPAGVSGFGVGIEVPVIKTTIGETVIVVIFTSGYKDVEIVGLPWQFNN